MIASDRLTAILDLLQSDNSKSINELADHFGVSRETIRRDVRHLDQEGRVSKVHGGVRLPENVTEEPYRRRLTQEADAKRQIATHAANLVEDGMTVFIDCGTTSYWLARALTHQRNLLIITNSMEVAGEVIGRKDCRLVFIGGQMDPEYRATFGPEAVRQTLRFSPDLMFLSIGAVDAQKGFLDFSMDEAEYKRAIMTHAHRCLILADSTKFERPGTVRLADLHQVDGLITEQTPHPALAKALRKAQVEVILAEPSPNE